MFEVTEEVTTATTEEEAAGVGRVEHWRRTPMRPTSSSRLHLETKEISSDKMVWGKTPSITERGDKQLEGCGIRGRWAKFHRTPYTPEWWTFRKARLVSWESSVRVDLNLLDQV